MASAPAVVAGCAVGSGSPGARQVRVAAAFYPLAFAVAQVGGDLVQVENLTKPGTEPHDLELSPAGMISLAKADLVVYLAGFQPVVDQALEGLAQREGTLDVSAAAQLGGGGAKPNTEPVSQANTEPGTTRNTGPAPQPRSRVAVEPNTEPVSEANTEPGATRNAGPAPQPPSRVAVEPNVDPGSEPAAALSTEHSALADPHFWLDPTRYADVGSAIADRLATADPANAAAYRAGAVRFTSRLHALDGELRTGLANCSIRDLVTGHAAFSYFAAAYGLHQVGIAGLSPDAEPEPAQLAQVARFVRDHGVRTVYAETLVSPAVADTVARETGARVAVLDPVEGITASSAGRDYFAVMRSNLRALRQGQECR
ncbi:MAG TPA: zinc ABC transporter substrate-binding protein [Dermatophilaceae bacterium]|nr:zinc ABC transporter substrate-binding protein [Dermatophilaceae bacterium]